MSTTTVAGSAVSMQGPSATARLEEVEKGGAVQLQPFERGRQIVLAAPISSGPDMQIVLGENEAGKSTAMAAIEDLLFGIPSNSPRNFLHEYNVMRVGATLEKGGNALKIRRRKGNKDTLLSESDVPLPSGEGALVPFLVGADRRSVR